MPSARSGPGGYHHPDVGLSYLHPDAGVYYLPEGHPARPEERQEEPRREAMPEPPPPRPPVVPRLQNLEEDRPPVPSYVRTRSDVTACSP